MQRATACPAPGGGATGGQGMQHSRAKRALKWKHPKGRHKVAMEEQQAAEVALQRELSNPMPLREKRAAVLAQLMGGFGTIKLLAKRFDVAEAVIRRWIAQEEAKKAKAAGLSSIDARPSLPGVAGHARDQAVQRYGVDFTPEAWLQAWLDIVEGRAALVRRSYRSEVFAVAMWDGTQHRDVFVAYMPEVAMIVTALPHGRRKKGALPT